MGVEAVGELRTAALLVPMFVVVILISSNLSLIACYQNGLTTMGAYLVVRSLRYRFGLRQSCILRVKKFLAWLFFWVAL